MAEDLKYIELKKLLGSPKLSDGDQFKILHQIAAFVNNPTTESEGRDLVLRALEKKKYFNGFEEILYTLVREVGLFPYLIPDSLSFKDRLAYEYHRPTTRSNDFVFHREQAFIYRKLISGESVVLSAPTSFGKSRIVDEIIRLNIHINIAIIVPTIALIDETRKRLSKFSSQYKLITQIGQKCSSKNLFIFTAERAIAFGKLPKINFFVIDEFYKLGNLQADNERTVSLNQIFYKLLKCRGQFFLLGPNIKEIPGELSDKYRCYVYPTNFTTVASDQRYVGDTNNKEERLLEICGALKSPTLIFCSSPKKVNDIARLLISSSILSVRQSNSSAAKWIAEHYHKDWIFVSSIEHGVGIHHGKLPRSLAQFAVKQFNSLKLRFLICTSTLIEGVNTKAKNVIVFDNAIAKKKIDYFTFNNIKGRSGRMFQHFVGRVFLFDHPPQEQLPFVDMPIVTQGENTPNSLLIQLDDEDLSDKSKQRLEKFYSDDIIPFSILKENFGIDPSEQIEAAKSILNDNKLDLLRWTSAPTWDQLLYICTLIWSCFVRSRRNGISSGKQLAYKLKNLSRRHTFPERIEAELFGDYAASSVDEAVERVLQFDRNWASYDFPRYLMALDNIQRHLLTKRRMSPGDYKYYTAKVESLFSSPLLQAFDEFGIPPDTGKKLIRIFKIPSDIDDAIETLKHININTDMFDDFEKDVLRDALSTI